MPTDLGDALNAAWLTLSAELMTHFQGDILEVNEWLDTPNVYLAYRLPRDVIREGIDGVTQATRAFTLIDVEIVPNEEDQDEATTFPLS
jgi:hypothetical protein